MVSMILDDLIYTKLVMGLYRLNLQPDNYFIDIGDKVIKLMGFKDREQNEVVYNYYQRLLGRSKYISLEGGNAKMRELAEEIYEELKLQKPI
jgi:hypothetical protein